MKSKFFTTLIVFSMMYALPGFGAKNNKNTLVGLTQGLVLEELVLNESAAVPSNASDFQIGPKGVPVFSAKNDIHMLIGKKKKFSSDQEISSFGFSPKGALFVVSGRQLGTIDKGKFEGTINLPFDKMKVAPKNEVSIFVYGNDPQNHGQVFSINSDGTFSKLIQTTPPIQLVKVVNDGLLVLTDKTIYRYREGTVPSPVLTLFNGSFGSAEIDPSLSPDSAPFFVTTGDGIFLSKQGRLVPLLANIRCQVAGYLSGPGTLATYALCPEKKKIYKLTVEIAKIPAEFHPAKLINTESKKEGSKWKK